MADLLTVLRDAKGGLRQVQLGRQADPLFAMASLVVAGHLLFVHRFEEVIAEVRYLRERFPVPLTIGADSLSSALWELGRFDESLEEFSRAWGDDPELAAAVHRGREESGPRRAMRAAAEHFIDEYEENRSQAFDIARCFARGGEEEAALDWLEEGYEYRLPKSLHAVFYPEFDVLSSNPRFQELLRLMNIPER